MDATRPRRPPMGRRVQQLVDQYGPVEVLVNNAGVTRDNLLMRMSEEEWDTVLNTNLKGAFNFTRALTRPCLLYTSDAADE